MNPVRSQLRLRRLVIALLMLALVAIGVSGPSSVMAQNPSGDGTLLRGAPDAPGIPKGRGPLIEETNPIILSPDIPEAPLWQGENRGQAIPGQYIVLFKPGTVNVPQLANQITAAAGGSVLTVYEHAVQGFAARLPAQTVLGLQRNPNVILIEQDQILSVVDTQNNATWGLDRIDQRDRPLNSTYVYNNTGAGVNAYIIDTGIRLTHSDFGGRARTGFDAVTSGGNASDCNGHGTHVAGTVGGNTWGVAKGVTLYAVRVLGCNGSGTNSGVIAGVDWVTANHVKPAVANMSLGGGASAALDTAVNNSINAGVSYAVAAGNDNRNACNYSPARVGAAVTVGSTTSTDARSSFSNFGTCLDLFAPGSSITSAWYTGDTATNTISGTSMASPHVAGVAALYLQANPSAVPSAVRDAIVNGSSVNKLTSIGTGSPNRLLYSLLTGGGPNPTPTPPPPTPTPPPGGNILVNPGFESGRNVGWAESSVGGYPIVTTNRPRTGSWSAWTGGYNNGTDQVNQRVTVPANGTLSYHWRMETSETSSTVYDYMDVRLYDGATGAFITTLRRWSNASTRNTWTQDTISLSGYAGRSVYVTFYARTDGSYATSFFVDDVSVR